MDYIRKVLFSQTLILIKELPAFLLILFYKLPLKEFLQFLNSFYDKINHLTL